MKKRNFYKGTMAAMLLAVGLGGVSFGQTNCQTGICTVSDLIVENGFTWTISGAYSLGTGESAFSRGEGVVISNPDNRTIVFQSVEEGAWLNVLFTRPGGTISYEQTKAAPRVMYDSLKGIITAPLIANATYQWYLDGALLDGAVNRTCIAQTIGTYKAEITWPTPSASASSSKREEATQTTSLSIRVKKVPVATGLSHYSDSETLSIYPNPASESVSIQEVGSYHYSLRDTGAKVVASGEGNETTKISLQGMTPGVYFMEVNTPFKTSRKKVMVK